MIASGRLTAWTALVAPFYDRPDITSPWLFYPAAHPYVPGPVTIFTDRFWDNLDHWVPNGPGTVPGSERPWFGPVPPAVLGPLVGSPGDWLNGLSYAQYLADGGSPLTPCAELIQDCAACPNGSFATLYLISTGWGGTNVAGAAVLNQTFTLTYQGDCLWQSLKFAVPGVSGLCQWSWSVDAGGHPA